MTKHGDQCPPKRDAQAEPDQMARNGKERAQQTMPPADSHPGDIHLPWQVGHQKADEESNRAPSRRGTNSRQRPVEHTPAPADAQPGERVKQTERLREAKRRLRRCILTLALNAGLASIGSLSHHAIAQFGSPAVASGVTTRSGTLRTGQGTRRRSRSATPWCASRCHQEHLRLPINIRSLAARPTI